MTTWIITIITLLTFPIIGFSIFSLTKNKIDIRNKVLWILFAADLFAIAGLLTNVSTTLTELDWIIVSSLYLTICTLLWIAFGLKNKIIKAISILVMICVLGLSYLSGTIGALGLRFITAEYTPEIEQWLGNGIIYKETSLGNAISDYRGKRVEIFQTISWLPIIEWRVTSKVYETYITIMTTPLTVNYKPNEDKIYLSASMWWENEHKQQEWSDTLLLKR